uniref:Uncharacterized protein n=1 Tax=Cyanothece sp. (strain PCC 7425 / ATCC 29141) TaxID=395961 RepID=B8HNT8_CYAP4
MLISIFARGIVVTLVMLPTVVLAQTQPSWQDWVKQNPTYPSPQPPSQPTATPPNSPSTWDNQQNPQINNPQIAQGFMQGCTASAPQAYCKCMLEQIQQKYTTSQLIALSSQYSETGQLPPEFIAMAQSCLGAK